MTDWKCLADSRAEFRFFTEPRSNFTAAVEFCETQGATLARISDSTEFEFVLDLVEDISFDNFYIGMLQRLNCNRFAIFMPSRFA